jgi:hypothetical protein
VITARVKGYELAGVVTEMICSASVEDQACTDLVLASKAADLSREIDQSSGKSGACGEVETIVVAAVTAALLLLLLLRSLERCSVNLLVSVGIVDLGGVLSAPAIRCVLRKGVPAVDCTSHMRALAVLAPSGCGCSVRGTVASSATA